MKTKILIMITIATIAMSCKKTEENNTENQYAVPETTDIQAPKCGDKKVKEALISSIYKEGLLNDLVYVDPSEAPVRKKIEINKILTISKNNDLQKCECEAECIQEFSNGEQRTDHIYYFTQKDSEGNLVVKQQDKPEVK